MWKVEVAVQFGEFFDSELKEIAAYQIREGEKAKVKQLVQYGLRPFDVSVVKVEQSGRTTDSGQQDKFHRRDGGQGRPLTDAIPHSSQEHVGQSGSSPGGVASNGRRVFALKRPEGTPFQSLIEPGQECTVEISSEYEHRSSRVGVPRGAVVAHRD